jgi:hypothetical protein
MIRTSSAIIAVLLFLTGLLTCQCTPSPPVLVNPEPAPSCKGDICTIQVTGPSQFLPPGTKGPNAGSWGYLAYQLRQGSDTFSYMSENGWWSKPPGTNVFQYSVALPKPVTISAISGAMNGITWCGNSSFWAEIRTDNGEPLITIKDQTTPTTLPDSFNIPIYAAFPNGLQTTKLHFLFMDDLCVPVTQSWGLTFSTGAPKPREFQLTAPYVAPAPQESKCVSHRPSGRTR